MFLVFAAKCWEPMGADVRVGDVVEDQTAAADHHETAASAGSPGGEDLH